MSKHRDLNSGDVLPASLLDALEEYISTLAANIVLSQTSTTAVKVAGGTGNGQAALGISSSSTAGAWRYITADATASHPGGAAGTYDVLAVASANDFVGAGDTDNTDYRFGLQIVAAGGSGSGTLFGKPVTAWRKIGIVEWSGTAITNVTQLVGPDKSAVVTPTAPLASVTPFIARGAAAQTAALAKFQDSTQATLVQVAADGKIQFGSAADTNLYRSAAATLKTDGAFVAVGGYSIGAALTGTPAYQSQQVAAQTVIRNKLLAADANDAFHVLGDGKQEWGAGGASALDANLYRSGSGVLKTDSAFQAASYAVGVTPLAASHLSNGTTGTGAVVLATSPVFATQATVGPITGSGGGGGGNAGVFLDAAGRVAAVRTADAAAIATSLTTDSSNRIAIFSGGTVWFGPGNAGVDTNLYRSAADTLKTDDTFRSALNIVARDTAAGQVTAGIATGIGTGVEAGIGFGSAVDANLYRTAGGALKTDGTLNVGTALKIAGRDVEVAFSSYKTILDYTAQLSGAVVQPAGTYPLLREAITSAGVGSSTVSPPSVFYLDPADFAADTRTTKLRLRFSLSTNQVAPGTNWTLGLYPATLVAGASGSDNTYTLGAAVVTVAINTPAASSSNVAASSDVTAPAAGLYVLAVVNSGSAASGIGMNVRGTLQMRQT